MAVALPAVEVSGASGSVPNPLAVCPAVGHDTLCGVLITVNPDGSTTVTTSGQGPIDEQEDTLVGVVNNSNALLENVSLNGADTFGLDGDGLCDAVYNVCTSPTEYGPTGYEGPGTSFTVTNANAGLVNFSPVLAPGASSYFTLESAPFSVSGVTLLPDISLTASSFSAVEGNATTPTTQLATFTDGPSTAPASDFTASVNWGDGSTPCVCSITQSSSGSPYVVTGSHLYAEEGTYTPKVTITDNALSLNTATASGTASVADAALTAAAHTIPAQTTGASSGSLLVATFTDGNPNAAISDFTTAGSPSISWGDGMTSSGSITQPGGVGTTFDVWGTHTYASHVGSPFTITVTINDAGGSRATVQDTVVVADAVITCSTAPCTGSVSSPQQSETASSPSTSGSILVSLDTTLPTGQAFSCNDPFRHATQYTTVADSGLISGSIVFTVTFANASAPGPWWVPFAVCYQSNVPFTNLFGKSVTTGLLPLCILTKTGAGPCIKSISERLFGAGNVVETVVIPSIDPKFR